MRIGVLNSWPNLVYSAEREFIARLKLACTAIGWDCMEVVTSEDVLQAQVDCVLVTHEYSPKLTGVPTIGLLWSPPDYFQDDPLRVRSVLSYDGYLAGSDSIRQYLEDLLFSTRKESPISDWNFLPTAQMTEFHPPDLSQPSLFYTGVHWDGSRHGRLIRKLRNKLPFAFYGDPGKWSKYGAQYKGAIPFDGVSIFEKINKAGVALCLHRDEHLKNDVPSMRIFEAAAAGAIIITEDSSFAKRHFGDSVLYVNRDGGVAEKAAQIASLFDWVRSHPQEAQKMAIQSHSIFNNKFSLEKLLEKLPQFLQDVKRAHCYDMDKQPKSEAVVEVIVRVGGRRLEFIERCLDSLVAQTYQNLGLVLVSYQEVAGLDHLVAKYANRFVTVKRVSSKPTGFRSTALWDGLRVIEADYFCNLDDDDTIQPNHTSTLVNLLEENKNAFVAYSGTIQVQDEEGHFYTQPNFRGAAKKEIKENRCLHFFEPFHKRRILRLENYIQSNAWLARKSVLEQRDVTDPKLIVSEDMLLYLIFLRSGDFLFSWRATAEWRWRSTSKDNSVLFETCQRECGQRVLRRTEYFYERQDDLIREVFLSVVTLIYRKYPSVKAWVRTTRQLF